MKDVREEETQLVLNVSKIFYMYKSVLIFVEILKKEERFNELPEIEKIRMCSIFQAFLEEEWPKDLGNTEDPHAEHMSKAYAKFLKFFEYISEIGKEDDE